MLFTNGLNRMLRINLINIKTMNNTKTIRHIDKRVTLVYVGVNMLQDFKTGNVYEVFNDDSGFFIIYENNVRLNLAKFRDVKERLPKVKKTLKGLPDFRSVVRNPKKGRLKAEFYFDEPTTRWNNWIVPVSRKEQFRELIQEYAKQILLRWRTDI